MKKFDNYKRNLAVLSRAGEQDLSNEFIIGGIIDKFSLQFELGWKVLKELLRYEGVAIVSGGELRAEVLANYLRHERLPDCTFLPENALYQRTYGTLPEGGVIIQQSHKRSQAARSFAA